MIGVDSSSLIACQFSKGMSTELSDRDQRLEKVIQVNLFYISVCLPFGDGDRFNDVDVFQDIVLPLQHVRLISGKASDELAGIPNPESVIF